MKDQDFIEAAKRLVEDRETLCNALGIPNPHNAKQALATLHRKLEELEETVKGFTDVVGAANPHNAKQRVVKLMETEAKYESLKQEIVSVTGTDNVGNGMKAIRAKFNAPLTHQRHQILEVAPTHWLETTDASRVEGVLNNCDRVLKQILEKLPESEHQERIEVYDDALWDPDLACRDFQKGLMKDLAGLSSNYRETTPPAPVRIGSERVNFADQLDSIFVTSYLSPTAIESLRITSATSPGSHLSAERFSQMTEQETAVPSRAGQTAATIARTLCAEAIFGEVPMPGTDEDVAFQGVVEDQDALFSALNDGGVAKIGDLVGEALLALEQESLLAK